MMNSSAKKHVKIIFGIGIPLGILLLVIQRIFHLSDDELWKTYTFIAIVAIGSALLFNLIWQLRFARKIKQSVSLLEDSQDINGFIEQTQQLLARVKSSHYKQLLEINLAVGFMRQEQYAQAHGILRDIDTSKLKGINRAIYYLDLANVCFLLENNADGIALMQEHMQLFDTYKSTSVIASSVLINRLHAYLALGHIQEAKQLLPEAEIHCDTQALKKELQLIKDKLGTIEKGENA